MAIVRQNHSILKGTLAEILAYTGDYLGQKAYASNYGVSTRGAKLFWNGSAWLWDTHWQPLSLLRSPFTVPGDLTEDVALTYTLPKLGANDMLRVSHFWSVTNNANVKTVRVNIGDAGTMATGQALALTSKDSANCIAEMRNMNNALSQSWFSNNVSIFGVTSGTLQTTTKDTSTAGRLLTITGQKVSVTGDSLVLNYADIWICGGGTA